MARPVRIVGVRLYGSQDGPCEYDVQVDVKEDNRVIATKSMKLQTDGSRETFPVYFEKPLQIQENTWYTTTVIWKGVELSFYGYGGLEEVEAGNSKTKFQFRENEDEDENYTDVEKGQIPDIVFI